VLARTALAAAEQQTVRLPAEQLTAQVSAELAGELLALRRRVKELDNLLRTRLATHPQAAILTSLPGLAAYAGLAPVPHDSGRRVNNLHRPHRYNRDLLRVFYVSALIAAQRPGASRDYYQRKRREGKHHIQVVLALARRRVNVLWALLRDNRPFTLTPPATPARLDEDIGSHLPSITSMGRTPRS
jgi:transposase